MANIYSEYDKYDENGKRIEKKPKEDFMNDKDIDRVSGYISQLMLNQSNLSTIYDEYADIEKYYQNEQSSFAGTPNTKIGIINANIEGQAAMVMEQDMAIMTRGESAGDDNYAEDARVGLEWTLRKNYFKRSEKEFVRRFLKFGNGAMTVRYDPDALSGFGLVKIYAMPLTRIFVDGKIKDPHRLQEGEFYAEAIPMSKTQVEDVYGEDKAEAIQYGNVRESDETDFFRLDTSSDDETGTTVLMYWSRFKGKLRLEEFTQDGLLLYDSHKSGDRKSNQKDKDYSHKSYYKFVNDKYPIFIAALYQREGNFWAFGDGKLLLPLQKLINELYDKIRICARPNLILYDTNSEVDLSDFDENSNVPLPFDGTMGNSPVQAVPWGQINESWWKLLQSIHEEVQRVTRFYDLMAGGGAGGQTATESALQHQQGSMSTNDKKLIIQSTLAEMLEYVLGIMIEKYTEGRSFRVGSDQKDYSWIDFKQMAEVPVKIPATQEFKANFKKNNPKKKSPKWELLTGDDGKALTKNIDIDVDVSIGAGLPKNKAFISQFMEKMSAVQLIDKQGQPKPALFWEEFRDFLKRYVGLPLEDNDVISQQMQAAQAQQMQQQQEMQQAQAQGQPQGIQPAGSQLQGISAGLQRNALTSAGQVATGEPLANANAEGMSAGGRPSMQNLNQVRQG